MVDTAASGLIRVNFSLRGFAKVVQQSTISPFTPEPAALQSFGRYLASLNLQPSDPIIFASVPEFRGVDYVGYIIEKERLDPTNGTWVRVEEYRIMGSQACSYQDTRVAYGSTYRYRIRSVIKYTFPSATAPQAYDTVQRQVGNLLAQSLKNSTQTNAPLLQRLSLQGLQSKSSNNTPVTVTLTDKITVTVDSQGVPRFNFNLTTANTTATDNTLTAIQALLSSGAPVSNATLSQYISTLSNYAVPSNAGKTYSSEYIVSPPSRNWKYVKIANDTLPPWPQSIQVVPNTPSGAMDIYWLPPPDGKLDLQSSTLYRRNAVGDPWARLATNLTSSYYHDTDIKMGYNYIYGMTTTSVHGYESFLSTQVQASLNPNFTFEQSERDLKWISGPGARPDEPDTVFQAFYDTSEQLIAYHNIAISPAQDYGDTNTQILLKIRSLDTQEKKEIKVTLTNKQTKE